MEGGDRRKEKTGKNLVLVEEVLQCINTLAQDLLPFCKIRDIGYGDIETGEISVFCSGNLPLKVTVDPVFSPDPGLEFPRGGIRRNGFKDLVNLFCAGDRDDLTIHNLLDIVRDQGPVKAHCNHLVHGVPGDLLDAAVGEDDPLILENNKAVLDVIRHHPEPLLALGNSLLLFLETRDIREDDEI